MTTGERLDLYKHYRSEYVTPQKPRVVEIGEAKYLAITGKGEPASNEFVESISALMGTAYTIKMTKKHTGQDPTRAANWKAAIGGLRRTTRKCQRANGTGSC